MQHFVEQLAQPLQALGLKDSDIQVYCACLPYRHGLTVAAITKATGLNRSTVNLVIERLLARSLLQTAPLGRRKQYFAVPPESLLFDLENTVVNLRSLLPLLKALNSNLITASKVQIYENKTGLEQLFNEILLTAKMGHLENKEILAVSSGRSVLATLPDHPNRFIAQRVKLQIPIRWIAPNDAWSQQFMLTKNEYRQMKLFDKEKYPFDIEIDIYGRKVAFLSFNPQPLGVVIANVNLADSFRALFNLLWDSLK